MAGTRPDPEVSVAEALAAWREKERKAVRATAQREAAEEAAASADLALKAAEATSRAADAAQIASSEAARAATATAEAAQKVMTITREGADHKGLVERQALAAEEDAKAAHKAAQDRAYERIRVDEG